MRLPRPLRRFLDPQTAVITGVKTALRAHSPANVLKVIGRHSSRLKLPRVQARNLAQIVVGRLEDSLDHEEATTRFLQLASDLSTRNLPESTWLVLENLSRSVGCFSASQSFTNGAHLAIENRGNADRVLLGRIHSRDLEGAGAHWLAHQDAHDKPLWQMAGHYLWLWSGGKHGAPSYAPPSWWSELIQSQSVIIMGPAETSVRPGEIGSSTLVARVIMQEVLSWNPKTDPLGGRCDLAYASREVRNWLRETTSPAPLNRFQAVSFRLDNPGQDVGLSGNNLRVARDPRALMLGGSSPNMIPLMVWDILTVPDVSLTVAGVTFFASAVAYTESNRRVKHQTGQRTDEKGGTGGLFERCPTFARHNVVENLTLVANLINGSAIEADETTTAVARMGVSDYLRRLDELYGRDRL